MGLFAQQQAVNSRGDTLSAQDAYALTGNENLKLVGAQGSALKLTPQQRGEMLYNWLTAGGPPKPVDVSKIFAEKEAMAPVEAKASAGEGINSLFGIGKLIGDVQPAKIEVGSGLEPIKMIEPINQSPLQSGVPYSTPALPGGK